ncbi:hypothetical protein HYD55_03505 [Mycoplasmopsis bovis]|nr:hypothetical protein [Mycoplasmopsis bovis]QQH71484.1 hypothetical protein HYD55_03505 [Mycoplasmopsis bovis]
MPKNDKVRTSNKIQLKMEAKVKNDGDNTSNNDQPIHNSNKSDKTVKDSNPKTETDQSSTNKEKWRWEQRIIKKKKILNHILYIQSNEGKKFIIFESRWNNSIFYTNPFLNMGKVLKIN